MVEEYREVNQLIGHGAMLLPRLKQLSLMLELATPFYTLDIIQGYWQAALHTPIQELFTMVIAGGLYTPTWVPQGVLHTTACVQTIGVDILDGLIGRTSLVWVDNIAICARYLDQPLCTLAGELASSMDR